MVEILYFASLREALDTAQEKLELTSQVICVADLKQLLIERGGQWQQAFTQQQSLLVSVNQQMADDDTAINDQDEIAFFPPVTGG
jgi:molybdopterin synthase sulfur carrier subunit